jgi:hypothetical protein
MQLYVNSPYLFMAWFKGTRTILSSLANKGKGAVVVYIEVVIHKERV